MAEIVFLGMMSNISCVNPDDNSVCKDKIHISFLMSFNDFPSILIPYLSIYLINLLTKEINLINIVLGIRRCPHRLEA
jgi:hypothetical protein